MDRSSRGSAGERMWNAELFRDFPNDLPYRQSGASSDVESADVVRKSKRGDSFDGIVNVKEIPDRNIRLRDDFPFVHTLVNLFRDEERRVYESLPRTVHVRKSEIERRDRVTGGKILHVLFSDAFRKTVIAVMRTQEAGFRNGRHVGIVVNDNGRKMHEFLKRNLLPAKLENVPGKRDVHLFSKEEILTISVARKGEGMDDIVVIRREG